MLKHTMTYVDFNGEEQTETFYFNLTKFECLEMDLGAKGGMEGYLQSLVDTKDYKTLMSEFKKIILASIGQKSSDGRRFIKSDEIRDDFAQTNAFVDLFMRMVTDNEFATYFINNIVPNVPNIEEAGSPASADVIQPLLTPAT